MRMDATNVVLLIFAGMMFVIAAGSILSNHTPREHSDVAEDIGTCLRDGTVVRDEARNVCFVACYVQSTALALPVPCTEETTP